MPFGTGYFLFNGTNIAEKTADALSEILNNAGLVQIDHVTQQNTANAEESASASEVLSTQAIQLQSLLNRFKLKGTK